MATFYLDLEGGNDASAGTSFATRWKTITSGATAARHAPGDTIRIMASPDPTLVGNATWTNNSRTVTLASAVTANVDTGEAAWTASANVTCTTSATRKQGDTSASIAIAAGFTTGLVAYKALGAATDFSAYQQLSFWVQVNAALAASTTLKLCLCSDAAGATPVDTFFIPAIPSSNYWVAFTVNKGSALGSSIQSVALYADADPGTVTVLLDNIIAVKAVSSADSLSLTSLIGKVHNMGWEASTSYSLNDKRRPTTTSRNGFLYKVTTAGTSGASEPTWPAEWGATVTDGTVVWTCTGNEETYYPIQSINGTDVQLDGATAAAPTITYAKYQGDTETVSTYKREPLAPFAMVSASFFSFSQMVPQEDGTADSPITYSGGWNRTDMSTQTGETWISAQNGLGLGLCLNTDRANIIMENVCGTRASIHFDLAHSYGETVTLRRCHGVAADSYGLVQDINVGRLVLRGVNLSNNASGIGITTTLTDGVAVTVDGNGTGSPAAGVYYGSQKIRMRGFVMRGNPNGAADGSSAATAVDITLIDALTANNNSGTHAIWAPDTGKITLVNATIGETATFSTLSTTMIVEGSYLYEHKRNGAADTHIITTSGGTIRSATDQRNTASGISWKFNVTATARDAANPLVLPLGKIVCTAGVAVTVKVWARRDSTNIKGKLMLRGGQLPGVPDDVGVACEPSINTWTESSALTFTPTEAGVVEVEFQVWDAAGTTNSFWIDDLTVT